MSSSDNPQMEPHLPVGEQPPQSLAPNPGGYRVTSDAPIVANTPVPEPTENPAWNGWDVLVVVVLAVISIFVYQGAIVVGAHYLVYPRVRITDLAQRPLLLLVSQFLIDGAIALYVFLFVEAKYGVRFGRAIRWNWPRGPWKWLVVGAAMLLGLSLLESILPMPKDTPFEKLFANPRDAYLLAIMAVTLGPLVEELFFRGMFYPVLARHWGAGWAVFLTALPFALMHMPQYGYAWGALLIILVVGIVCGIVRAVTGSVGSSFLVHVGYNGTQMLIAILFTRGFTHIPKSLLGVVRQ